MQQTLFITAADNPTKRKDLTISKSHQKQVLSKPQQAFNKLVKKIEKLREELKSTATILDEKLNYYAGQIHPLETEMTVIRTGIVKTVFGYYTQKKPFLKKDKEVIRDILKMQLAEILKVTEEPDAELKEIFEKIHDIKYEDAAEEDFQEMKDEMESMFEDFGFDINLDGVHSKMTPEEIMAKMAEMQQQFAAHAESRQQQKASAGKTKKQLEKEGREKQIEEAKKKNINTIYRQLAKIFHPDLEPDEDMKLLKTELMKQLTVANENNDLHTLLRLEMQWLQKEENDPAKLGVEKLKIYNEVMKEQVADLEQELFELENHPRFAPLGKFAGYNGEIKDANLVIAKADIEWMKKAMSKSLANLEKSTDDAIMEIKSLIQQYKQAAADDDDDDFMDFEDALLKIIQTGGGGKRR